MGLGKRFKEPRCCVKMKVKKKGTGTVSWCCGWVLGCLLQNLLREKEKFDNTSFRSFVFVRSLTLSSELTRVFHCLSTAMEEELDRK